MHLKNLTLRGFKSFASATTLEFEPGITCVVGPNGSGKSNVVDAIAWVLGEQGARTLRGGSMADVIFAGTAGRAPLGRAEVSLTIDNSDGAIHLREAADGQQVRSSLQPGSDITITRTMFRAGGSEYAINGRPARLLDVVELLSDAGVGREMHVIVGQNSLDTVLAGTPMDRRGLLEEAAGVLKHRKRKEKALRKLESMQANLTRLQDLTAEVRRQLTPLGRQADAARRAAGLQAELRDASLRLLADDLLHTRQDLAQREADEQHTRAQREGLERELSVLRERDQMAAEQAGALADRLRQATSTASAATALAERYRASAAVAMERQRAAEQVLAAEGVAPQTQADPGEKLLAEAQQIAAREQQLREQLAAQEQALAAATQARTEAEAAVNAAERERTQAMRAASLAQQARTRWAAEVATVRSRIESRTAELARLEAAATEAGERAEGLAGGITELAEELAQAQTHTQHLKDAADAAEEQVRAGRAELDQLRASERSAASRRSAELARGEALRLALASRTDFDAGAALGDQAGPPLSEVVTVEPEWEVAVAAALGAWASAVTVPARDAALRGLAAAVDQQASAAFVHASPELAGEGASAQLAELPAGALLAAEVVSAPPALESAVRQLLATVVLTYDLPATHAVLAAHPQLTVVTRDGQLLCATGAKAPDQAAASAVELRAAAAEADSQAAAADHQLAQLQTQREQGEQHLAHVQSDAKAATEAWREAHSAQTALTERLTQAQRTVQVAEQEAQRAQKTHAQLAAALAADQQRLPQLEAQEAQLAAPVELPDPDDHADATAELAQAASQSRQHEMEVRLMVRTTEERLATETRRAQSARQRAADEQAAHLAARERQLQALQQRQLAAEVGRLAEAGLAVTERIVAHTTDRVEALEQQRARSHEQAKTIRERATAVATDLEHLRALDENGEVACVQVRLRVERLEERAREEFAVDPDLLVEEYGPHQPVPPSTAISIPADPTDLDEAEEADQPSDNPRLDNPRQTVAAKDHPHPYVRSQQEKRRRAAEKALKALGVVNPLALEEFAAMEERHRFLSEQLADLTATRKDLLTLVAEVDTRVQEIFQSAYDDTAREFERVFARLFPGGEGRLVLTDPTDMTVTGIEVEARPPGKRVKRLSLLSGGERSLTALAFLVALFQARPSPFYVLDEVEAALDDVNLGRLIGLLEDIRETSQLIIITHQKRTMEIADALYGVSMRGDGISTVIGQRLRETQPA